MKENPPFHAVKFKIKRRLKVIKLGEKEKGLLTTLPPSI